MIPSKHPSYICIIHLFQINAYLPNSHRSKWNCLHWGEICSRSCIFWRNRGTSTYILETTYILSKGSYISNYIYLAKPANEWRWWRMRACRRRRRRRQAHQARAAATATTYILTETALFTAVSCSYTYMYILHYIDDQQQQGTTTPSPRTSAAAIATRQAMQARWSERMVCC